MRSSQSTTRSISDNKNQEPITLFGSSRILQIADKKKYLITKLNAAMNQINAILDGRIKFHQKESDSIFLPMKALMSKEGVPSDPYNLNILEEFVERESKLSQQAVRRDSTCCPVMALAFSAISAYCNYSFSNSFPQALVFSVLAGAATVPGMLALMSDDEALNKMKQIITTVKSENNELSEILKEELSKMKLNPEDPVAIEKAFQNVLKFRFEDDTGFDRNYFRR